MMNQRTMSLHPRLVLQPRRSSIRLRRHQQQQLVMIPLRVVLLLLLLLGGGGVVSAQDTEDDDDKLQVNDTMKAEFKEKIEAEMKRIGVRGAGIVAMHMNLSEPFIGGYGCRGEVCNKVDAETAFVLASVSKGFAGMAIAAMLDQGEISSLDEDICLSLPRGSDKQRCRHPDHNNTSITWRMLATHRSSLVGEVPEVEVEKDAATKTAGYAPIAVYGDNVGNIDCPMENKSSVMTDVRGFYHELLQTGTTKQTDVGKFNVTNSSGQPFLWWQEGDGNWNDTFAPGFGSDYSNLGIGYIPALVEYNLIDNKRPQKIKNFDEFCQQHLFGKLNMTRTSWFGIPGNNTAKPNYFRNNTGNNNNLKNNWTDIVPTDQYPSGQYCFIDYASGQLYSTPNDLYKFGAEMVRLGNGGSTSVNGSLFNKSTTVDAVFGCQEKIGTSNDTLPDANCSYSLGWEFMSNAQRAIDQFEYLAPYRCEDWTNGLEHAGFEEGVQTQMVILPRPGVILAVLTNTGNNGETAAQDLAAVAGEVMMQYVWDWQDVPDCDRAPTSPPTTAPAPARLLRQQGMQQNDPTTG